MKLPWLSLIALSGLCRQLQALPCEQQPYVNSNVGVIQGVIDPLTPDTRQFRSIPYAKSPDGPRRWLAPMKLDANESSTIDASQFPPPCAQYGSRIFTEYTRYMPRTKIPYGNQGPIPGTMFNTSSEDCLYLSVTAPAAAVSEKLPVIVFIPGGGFVLGGAVNIEDWKPPRWVQRTQSHIVVTMNYRLGILGFPNAPGLEDLNLGLLDQRAALEWVYENIAAFGGDPDRMTLWGQSAGASSVDYHNFAFASDPLVKGLFEQSGSTVLGGGPSPDSAQTNFTFVSGKLGCGGLGPVDQLECMRNISAYEIVTFVGAYQDNTTDTYKRQPPLSFIPTVDEKIVFSNYTQRFEKGEYSKLPAILSHTANEFVTLTYTLGVPVQPPGTITISADLQKVVNNHTLSVVVCPNTKSAALRVKQRVPTYSYEWAGNFSNIAPRPFYGAFHASDIPIIMGAYLDEVNPSTGFEIQVAEKMQDSVLAFMRDPLNGPASQGWYDISTGQVIRFGADNRVSQNVSSQYYQEACALQVPWDYSP